MRWLLIMLFVVSACSTDSAEDTPQNAPEDAGPEDTTPLEDAPDVPMNEDVPIEEETQPDVSPEDEPLPDVPDPDPNPGCVFEEPFGEGVEAWPERWEISGGVAVMDVVEGRGRLLPEKRRDPYSLARVTTPGCDLSEGEFSVRFQFTEAGTQGIGLYLRANGGWLEHTNPTGAGYGLFMENFRNRRLGIWREIDGDEQEVLVPNGEPLPIGVDLRARFRVEQIDPQTTQLSGRVWIDGEEEPDTWDVQTNDTTPELQNIQGQVVLDVYSSVFPGDPQDPGDVFIDDIVVNGL